MLVSATMGSRWYLGIVILMNSIYENKCAPLAITSFPNDTKLFHNQNSVLSCIFNNEVNCIWKKDSVIVTMDNHTDYIFSSNGKNTPFCSLQLFTVSKDDAGIWSCENEINEPNATSVIARAKVTVQECGRLNGDDIVEEKIAGGYKSLTYKYPWIVTIHNKSKNPNYPLYSTLRCSGNLISNRWILTAGHCAYKDRILGILNSPAEYFVIFGRHELITRFNEIFTPWRDVCQIVVHPLFDRLYLDYDIALMKLKSPVEFSKDVSPICLPPPDINYNEPELMATIAGFGETEESEISPFLMEITVPVIPFGDCWRVWNSREMFLSERMICASQLDGKKLLCQGDSGSGLMLKYTQKNKTRYVVIGLTSSGSRYCPSRSSYYPNEPDIFTKVESVLPFINSYINDEEECPT